MTEKIIEKLLTFGYNKREAKTLAKEITQNLNNYITIQDTIRKEQSDRLRTTQQPDSRGLLAGFNIKRNNGR